MKCVKCIKDKVTGECYDIKDAVAREELITVKDDLERLKNDAHIADVEVLKGDVETLKSDVNGKMPKVANTGSMDAVVVVRKGTDSPTVDSKVSTQANWSNGLPVAWSIMQRDSFGRSEVNDPDLPLEIANKRYVDKHKVYKHYITAKITGAETNSAIIQVISRSSAIVATADGLTNLANKCILGLAHCHYDNTNFVGLLCNGYIPLCSTAGGSLMYSEFYNITDTVTEV